MTIGFAGATFRDRLYPVLDGRQLVLYPAALFLFTLLVGLYPAHQNAGAANPTSPDHGAVLSSDRPKVEVVFVLDTTGSMGGLIQAAKEKIWSIATTMAQAQPAPEIRIGLVAYRDRGDSYITRVVDLSTDLESIGHPI